MKTVEIHEITINDDLEANKNLNYPNNGLFIVKTKSSTDLRFIDKNVDFNFCIVPSNIFYNLVSINKSIEIAEDTVQQKKYDGDFILEFSRILLNRK